MAPLIRYMHIKAPRKLVWKPALGMVTLDVTFADRTVKNVRCSPLHATILDAFGTQPQWSLRALSAKLKVDAQTLKKRLALWINRGFILEKGRTADVRDAARILRGRKIAPGVRAMVSPGSTTVRREAEAEGLDRIFLDAGFEWRQSGCSMCLAMNDDVLAPGERCASSTNRNFEGRQGSGGRTHLMSPAMVAAAAVAGTLADVRDFPVLET